MQWMVEEARLGPEQREILDEFTVINEKTIWIQGHAGSGKSIVLLHALKDYLILNPNANVVVVVFTHSLVDLLKTGLEQLPFLQNRRIPVITIYDINKRLYNNEKFDAIFCDEIQDIPTILLERMKNGCTKLVIAGDAAQSIYSSIPNFNERPATKEEILERLLPVQRSTTTIYRLTKTVINVLKNVYNDLFSEMAHIGKEDSQIRLFIADDYSNEIKFCWEQIRQINQDRVSEVNAVLFFLKNDIIRFIDAILIIEKKQKWSSGEYPLYNQPDRDFDKMNEYLESQEIPIMYIGNGIGSLNLANELNKIVIMTYHSSKGLDFDAVCLPNIQQDLSSCHNENALILVALSRAKRDLMITYTENMYSGYYKFLKDTPSKEINNKITDSEDAIF